MLEYPRIIALGHHTETAYGYEEPVLRKPNANIALDSNISDSSIYYRMEIENDMVETQAYNVIWLRFVSRIVVEHTNVFCQGTE